MLVANVEPLDDEELVADPEAARRSALLALEAVEARLRDVPNATGVLPLLLPHMHLLPTEVQQSVLESSDPVAWVRALSDALRDSTR